MTFQIKKVASLPETLEADTLYALTASGRVILHFTDKDGTATYSTHSDTNINTLITTITGALSNLTTTDKSSLVAAINELQAASGGGGGVDITDDTTTDVTVYPLLSTAISGAQDEANVSSTKLYFNPSTGMLSATQFDSLSDSRFKTNIQLVQNAVEKVLAMRGVSFDWIENNESSLGVIAQDLELIEPNLVNISPEEVKSVNYNGIIAILIEALKAQIQETNNLNTRLELIESKLTQLDDILAG